jgi:transcriptional regulator with XRE-family HTH domain
VVRKPEPLKGSGVASVTTTELAALAAAVREIRARQQLSQEAVADAGELNRNTVGMVERREITPSFGALVGIARGLGVPLSELVRVYEERLQDASRRG